MILDSLPMRRRPTVRYIKYGDLDVGTGAESRQRIALLDLTLGASAGEHHGAHA